MTRVVLWNILSLQLTISYAGNPGSDLSSDPLDTARQLAEEFASSVVH